MRIEQIRELWKNHADEDMNASVEMWDSVSSDYKDKPIPTWDTSNFYKLLSSTVDFSRNMCVLDIGCGTGINSIGLADKVKKVVGVDLSPQMIKFAKEKAAEHSVNNAEFFCEDWNTFDIEKEGFKEKFDLVFAHMTPAINSAATFEKLISCSSKYFFLVKPTRRSDSVMDKVAEMVGINNYHKSSDDNIVYAFDMLWQMGYCPKLSYYDDVWEGEKSMEDAYTWYISRAKTHKKISEDEEIKLKEYLNSLAVDGKIYEIITTTIVTMYWEK